MKMSKFRDLGIAVQIPVKFLTFSDSNMAAMRNSRLQVRINTAAIKHRSLNCEITSSVGEGEVG